MSTTTTQSAPNGVDVTQLVETIGAIKQDPTLATFRFRAKNTWLGGGHSRTSIQGFWGAGQEDATRERPFILEGDEPPVLLGANHAPTQSRPCCTRLRPAWLLVSRTTQPPKASRFAAWSSTSRASWICMGSLDCPRTSGPGTAKSG
jgi:hypothetical protein